MGHSDVERMQVNCWISGEAGERMKALAKAQNISYGQLLTALLLNQPVAVQDWQAAVSELIGRVSEIEVALSSLQSLQCGDELRGMIADQDVRLNRIETAILSGLGGRDAMVRVTVSAADLEPVEADDDTISHPADFLSLQPQQFNQDKAQFDAACVELYRSGVTSYQKIVDILTKKGYRNSAGKPYWRDGVKKIIARAKEAGLVE